MKIKTISHLFLFTLQLQQNYIMFIQPVLKFIQLAISNDLTFLLHLKFHKVASIASVHFHVTSCTYFLASYSSQLLLCACMLRGGSRGFIFGTITFEITYVQCTRVVCTTFKCILRLLGQIVFFGGHIGGFKTLRKKKSTITQNQN